MEYPEFLQKLRETPRDWYVSTDKSQINGGGRIRRLDGLDCQCPMTSLMDDNLGTLSFCAEQLGLSDELKDKIMFAADNLTYHDHSVRADLLEACGLTEGA